MNLNKNRNKIIWVFEAVILIVILVVEYYYNDEIERIGEHQIVDALLQFIVFVILINYTSRIVKYYYSKRNGLDPKKKNNVHFGIENLAKSILSIGFILTLASSFGIEPKLLLTSLSIVAAAIAIITRDFINDFLSGIDLSFSRTFEINDYVSLEKHKGNVLEIGLFKTKLLNEDGDVVIVPNGKINASDIINYTKRDIRMMSIDFQVALVGIESVEKLEQDIIQTLEPFKEYIDSESYNLKVVELMKDYMDLKFQYQLNHFDADMQRQIRRKMVREILNFLSIKKLQETTVPVNKQNLDL